VPTLNYMKLN